MRLLSPHRLLQVHFAVHIAGTVAGIVVGIAEAGTGASPVAAYGEDCLDAGTFVSSVLLSGGLFGFT